MILLSAGRAESALSASSIVKVISFLVFTLEKRGDNHLSDTLIGVDGLFGRAVVVEGDHNLSSVISVDYAYFVGRCESSFASNTAASIDETNKTFGDCGSDACMNENGLTGLNGYRRVENCAKVSSCGKVGAVCRNGGSGVELLKVNFHWDFLSYKS